MARTIYKRNPLRLGASQLIENVSASHSRNTGIFSHNGSGSDTQSLNNHNHSDDSSVNRNLNVWDDNASNSSSSSAALRANGENASQSFFCWRKYLYLGLSKPTHFDVELLDRIRGFGKLKTAIALFFLLLFLMMCGMGWKMENSSSLPGIVDDSSCDSQFSWLSINNLVERFISNVAKEQIESTISHEMLSRADMKTLIQEVLEDEIIPQLLSKRSSQRAKDTISIDAIKKELSAFNLKMSSLSEIMSAMQVKSEQESKQSSTLHEKNLKQDQQFQELNDRIKSLKNQILVLDGMIASAKNCCRNDTEIERQAAAILLSVMSTNPKNPMAKLFRDWLSAQHVSSEQFHNQVKKIQDDAANQAAHIKSVIANEVKESIDSIRQEFNTLVTMQNRGEGSGSISTETVQKIVKNAIDLYDADKTGETDYALESGGGAVVSTRCSETYNDGRPSYVFLGIPFWTKRSSPRDAIQPDMHPGSCWAFKGSHGYLVVELSAPIRPTSFVIEHIPKCISPTENIDSAPKDFSVWGLASEKDDTGVLLGEYVYNKEGESLQYFPVQNEDGSSYSYVELQLHSNHGDPKYTCLYRFRVHGIRA